MDECHQTTSVTNQNTTILKQSKWFLYADHLELKTLLASIPRKAIFLFSTMPSIAPGYIQPSVQWVLGTLSPGVKWLESEADNSTPSSTKVKNTWSNTSSWFGA
jgi:hypothetical protein